MHERIRQLALEAGVSSFWMSGTDQQGNPILERFAELIVKECMDVAKYHTPETEECEYTWLIHDKIKQHFGVEE